MKKQIIKTLVTIAFSVAAVATIAGCGAKKGANNVKYVTELEIGKYLNDFDYKAINISIAPPTVDRAYAAYIAKSQFESLSRSVDKASYETGRAVQNGDMINLDYSGKKDGEIFEGGTAQDQFLLIGSHTFINGFEDGLIGVKPGETVDLNLTFPENYSNADLAGADVVFTCTVNGIVPQDEIYASWNANYPTYDPVDNYDDFTDMMYDLLLQSARSEYENKVNNSIVSELIESVDVKKEFPASLILEYQNEARNEIESNAAYYGYSNDDYAQAAYGMSADSFIQDSSYEQLKLDAAICYVAEKEGISVTDEDMETRLKEIITSYGYDDYEEAKELLGIDLNRYRVYFLEEDVISYMRNDLGIVTE